MLTLFQIGYMVGDLCSKDNSDGLQNHKKLIKWEKTLSPTELHEYFDGVVANQ